MVETELMFEILIFEYKSANADLERAMIIL